ncbi:MAG: RNA pseudouridine synthase [Saprospiraceae bacterium]|nr:MAG: RNA pseudouridine synthase [Saprospiraceae bacterium]
MNPSSESQGRISEWVVYNTNQLVVFNKPPGMPVQPDKTGDTSLIEAAMAWCKHTLFLVHRLDRPCSGLVVFAKNGKAANKLSQQFKTQEVAKTYLAVVAVKPEPEIGVLHHFLKKNPHTNKTYVSADGTGKAAILEYQVLESIQHYHLLQVRPTTGRHHQIRAQLAAIGSPIRGDVKYGFRRGNRDRSIHLHAWKIAFQHPVSGERLELMAPPPADSLWQAFEFVRQLATSNTDSHEEE